jgi:uncharacterized delta-60 repeat protein
MASLFISYSRKNIESARRLTEAFQSQDLDFWIDWEGIPPTVDWWKEIETGIEEADIFLFLISPDSCQSKICRQEIEHAVKNGKRLIPLVVCDVNPEEAPAELGHLNWIFVRETDDFDLAFGKLINAIKTDYAWVQAHRELQVKALEWEKSGHENSFLLFGKELHDAEFQLATNTSKEPHPTDLQREYVHRSRKAVDRRRARNAGITTVAAIALAALAIFGFVQAKLATDRANIALARQLAAQAQSISTSRNSKQMTAVLLAVQSMKLLPTTEGAQILLNHNVAAPSLAQMTHDDGVTSVAFSPDGRYVVSGSYDATARIWEVDTGKEIASMTHDDGVTSVAFSPDGKYVVSGSFDTTARVWEVTTGQEVASIPYGDMVTSVAFSPNGKYVVSGSYNGSARIWEVATGNDVVSMNLTHDVSITNDSYVFSVAFSPDGKYVVSGSYDNTARLWELATGREIARITHDELVDSVAFSPDGKYVVSGSADATARVSEATTGREVARMTHDDVVTSVAFSPDGKYVVSGSYDNTVRVWKVITSTHVARIPHNSIVYSVAFSPDGRYVVSGSGDTGDTMARVWEFATGNEVARMPHPEAPVFSVAFSPDGKYVVSGSYDNTARVWEVVTGREVNRMTYGGIVFSVAFSSDGMYVLSGGCDKPHVESGGCVNGSARVSHALTGEEVARMTYNDAVTSAAFSPDGKYVVSTDGYSAQVWEIATGKEVAHMADDAGVSSVAFSPDGQHVVSGSGDAIVHVWEAATGKEVARLAHDASVKSVAFSLDGKYIVSGSMDKTARVWDVATGREMARIMHDDVVNSVAFSPDGKYVVLGGDDNNARVWMWQAQDLIIRACESLPRNLTRDEWQQFIGDALPYQAVCENLPIENEITPTASPVP